MDTKQGPVIEMLGISKRFGDFYANKNINLTLEKGEIHALLGENGAGKSTLMNMLSGLLEPTSGSIYINGQPAVIDSPGKANELGIGMVHQHFMLINAFTVLENIILGAEPGNSLKINKDQARSEIISLSQQYGLGVDPDAVVDTISVGMQQRVEILKVLYRGADILIFDEPTASLTPQEITDLMAILKAMSKEGKSIIIITHKLDEIKAVADRCTVIRRGESIDTVDVARTSINELATMMVGRNVSFATDKAPADPQEVIFQLDSLRVTDDKDIDRVRSISLTVRRGEIVGIAGIDGNGQSEMILAINGLLPITSGTVTFLGQDTTQASPRELYELGMGHIPEDRHKYGLILDMRLDMNFALKNYYQEPYSHNGFLNFNAISENARQLIESYDVRTSSQVNPARSLSGGNQQKAIIAREIAANPELLVAANPTRGLDVGAIEYIHQALINHRDKNKGVLLMSFELDEILDVSDRILVMFDGKIMADLPASETNEQELGLLMAGASLEEVLKGREQKAASSSEKGGEIRVKIK